MRVSRPVIRSIKHLFVLLFIINLKNVKKFIQVTACIIYIYATGIMYSIYIYIHPKSP